jgi:PAS domain S-box-containing protein
MEHQEKSPADLTGELEAMKQRFSRLECERLHLTNLLRYAESEKRTLLDSLQEHVVYHDLNLRVLWANRSACESAGIPVEKLAGRHCYAVWAKRSTPCEDCPVNESIKTGQPQAVEKKTPDGRSWRIKAFPVTDYHGVITGMIELTLEITEQKEAEKALEEEKKAQKSLEEQKDFLNTLLETISKPVFYKDEHGEYTGCNRAFEQFTGRTRADIIGRTVYDIWPEEIADTYRQKDLELLEKPGRQRYEWKIKNADGELRDAVFDKATLKDTSGRVIGLIGVISDITELKLAEAARRKHEETLKAILTASPIGICLTRSRILEWTNPAMYRMWGYEMDSLTGQSTRLLYADDEAYERVGREFDAAIEKNGVGKIETQWITRSGRKIHCHLQGCRLDPNDFSRGTITAAMDITERKHAEDLVRNLSQLLLNAQENERQMIAYELHDSIAQSLSSLKIDCDTFFDNQGPVSPQIQEKMARQSKLIAQIIGAVRDLSYGLHPPSLKQMGVVQTLSQLCEDFSDKTGLTVEFRPAGLKGLTPGQTLGINLYRLVQEGLNNIRKHAAADHVSITLLASHPNIILRIEDNGKGFDVRAREAALDGKKKMGLRSMAERVGLLNGRMKIQSSPWQGTRILIKIPLMKDEENGGSKNTRHHH